MKKNIKIFIEAITSLLVKTSGGRFVYEKILQVGMNINLEVEHNNVKMNFISPNALSRYRSESFSKKEPETLKWLDNIPGNDVLWDIGANVGLYSVYAAKKNNIKVYAFEPSVFNLELLARNVYINNLSTRITILPIALSDVIGANLFKMSSTAWGGALSTFSKEYGQNGELLDSVFQYVTLGMTMNAVVDILKIPLPQFIKIDVDGIEHIILSGGVNVLENVKSVLVEINDDFLEQAEHSSRYLSLAGLVLKEKFKLSGSRNMYNQWWVRNE